jgi:hypothetical protein
MTVPDFNDAIRAEDPDGEPLAVVPFPTLDPATLFGLPGKIITAAAPFTEAHPAAMLVQLLAHFGAVVGPGPHMQIGNRQHPARLYPLIVGKTSDGAKGTSYEVVRALFAATESKACSTHRGGLRLLGNRDDPLRRVSGMSSGEGLIEAVRDDNGLDPDAKGFDEGIVDKRLLIIEQEFTGMLAVMERQGSILPRIVREAWDGDVLRTLTRSPLVATGAHIIIVGHVTPGELRLRLKEAQILGGTMNRFTPVASRRTKLLPDGGNLPQAVLDEYGAALADALAEARKLGLVERTSEANELWRQSYPGLRKARPDGPVASILARSGPQVLRMALAYALTDHAEDIGYEHLHAALSLWSYVESTAEWMFGGALDTGEVDGLIAYINSAGLVGRTRVQISSDYFKRNKSAAELDAMLGELLRDGRVRQETDRSKAGRPAVRYFAC